MNDEKNAPVGRRDRCVWWPAPTLVDINAVTPGILAANHLDITSAAA